MTHLLRGTLSEPVQHHIKVGFQVLVLTIMLAAHLLQFLLHVGEVSPVLVTHTNSCHLARSGKLINDTTHARLTAE